MVSREYNPERVQVRRRTYDETKEIVEPRNRFRDDPSKDPKQASNSNPSSDTDEALLVHMTRAAQKSDVDILAINMTNNDSGDEDLVQQVSGAVETNGKGRD